MTKQEARAEADRRNAERLRADEKAMQQRTAERMMGALKENMMREAQSEIDGRNAVRRTAGAPRMQRKHSTPTAEDITREFEHVWAEVARLEDVIRRPEREAERLEQKGATSPSAGVWPFA